MITYDYQDAPGYERGDMGKEFGKPRPKATRIYILQRIDHHNRLAHLTSYGVYGSVYFDVLPLHTVQPLPTPIQR